MYSVRTLRQNDSAADAKKESLYLFLPNAQATTECITLKLVILKIVHVV